MDRRGCPHPVVERWHAENTLCRAKPQQPARRSCNGKNLNSGSRTSNEPQQHQKGHAEDQEGQSQAGPEDSSGLGTMSSDECAEPPAKRPAAAPSSRASTTLSEAQRTVAAIMATDRALQVTVWVHVPEHALALTTWHGMNMSCMHVHQHDQPHMTMTSMNMSCMHVHQHDQPHMTMTSMLVRWTTSHGACQARADLPS